MQSDDIYGDMKDRIVTDANGLVFTDVDYDISGTRLMDNS